ncbi:MAG: hypothetical protein E6F99_26330 [Actinobacteria bacterium]|nr:MAG: hypothetical protein E6F99_26330 [Actinomycetota bacterium]
MHRWILRGLVTAGFAGGVWLLGTAQAQAHDSNPTTIHVPLRIAVAVPTSSIDVNAAVTARVAGCHHAARKRTGTGGPAGTAQGGGAQAEGVTTADSASTVDNAATADNAANPDSGANPAPPAATGAAAAAAGTGAAAGNRHGSHPARAGTAAGTASGGRARGVCTSLAALNQPLNGWPAALLTGLLVAGAAVVLRHRRRPQLSRTG